MCLGKILDKLKYFGILVSNETLFIHRFGNSVGSMKGFLGFYQALIIIRCRVLVEFSLNYAKTLEGMLQSWGKPDHTGNCRERSLIGTPHLLIEESTHIAGNILDLILTNVPENISSLIIHSEPPLPIPSDHFIITFDYSTVSNGVNNSVSRKIFNFPKGDYDGLCNFIYHSDFTLYYMSEDIEFVWSYLSNLIRNAFGHFIPIITVQDNNHPPWFNSDIRHHIKCLRTLRRKHSKHPTDYNHTKLENSQVQLQSKISDAKNRYECNLVTQFAGNSNSKIYKYIRNLTKSTSIHIVS